MSPISLLINVGDPACCSPCGSITALWWGVHAGRRYQKAETKYDPVFRGGTLTVFNQGHGYSQ